MVEHARNDYDEMDPRIHAQNIQIGVIGMIKDKLQPAFAELDESFQTLAEHVAQLKNVKSTSEKAQG